MYNFRQLIDPLSFFPLILSVLSGTTIIDCNLRIPFLNVENSSFNKFCFLFCYRQMVGRILVEIFRSAANTETKLPVEEYMKYVHQISDDPGKRI